MMEPRRLLEQGATDAERALLHSARADGPPAGAAQRLSVVLDGLVAGTGGSGAPVAAHAIKLGLLAKVGLAAVVGLGAVGAGTLVLRMGGQRAVPSETSGARPPLMQEEQPALLSAGKEPSQPSFLAERATPTPGSASEAGAPPRGPGAPRPRRQEDAPAESLSAEIRILDAVRAAVDAHNPAAAQRALDSYAQRFPLGHLQPEATVLRLAVLVRQGNHVAARSLAAQLLASESYKAYQYRIRSLLRETE